MHHSNFDHKILSFLVAAVAISKFILQVDLDTILYTKTIQLTLLKFLLSKFNLLKNILNIKVCCTSYQTLNIS